MAGQARSPFSERLALQFDRLSASHQRLARFFSGQPWQAATLTAAEIANQLKVNSSTVVRFAQALGYQGLSDLQKELQQNVAEKELRRKDTLERASFIRDMGMDSQGSEAGMLARVFKDEVQNTQRTFERLEAGSFWEAVEAVVKAEHVYVVGMRASAPLGIALLTGLRYLRPRVYALGNQYSDLADQISSISNKDALIAYSYSPYVAVVVQLLELSKNRGATTIAITDDALAPAARASHHALIVHNPLWLLSSDGGSIALTNAFLFGVASRLGDRFEKYRDQARDTLSGMVELLDHEKSDRVAALAAWLEGQE
jgi:DNA-binding MurR/RpiR family transcriptional regulator